MVSIIVPTTGDKNKLLRLAKSFKKQTCSTDVEILFICNPPNPGLERHFQSFASLTFFHTEFIGSNNARNLGIENSHGDLLLFVDDDCEATDPHFIEKHIKAHEQLTDVVAIGGNYHFPFNHRESSIDFAYFTIQQEWVKNGAKPGFYSDCVFGGNLSVKRRLLGNVRFDKSLVYGGTETDFVFRLVADRQQVRFLDSLLITHHSDLRMYSFCKKAYFQGLGARLLRDKNYHGVCASFPVERKSATGFYPFLFSEFFLIGESSNSPNFSQFIFCLSLFQIFTKTFFKELRRILFRNVWNFLELAIFSGSKK